MKADMTAPLAACAILLAALPGLAVAQARPQPAETVGRLFFTPAQRAQLDTARNQRARTVLSGEEEDTEQSATPTPQTLTYSGMVRRSDGKSTVWINNRPVHDNDIRAGAMVGNVRPDGRVTLQTTQSGRSFELKPGQSVELLSGTVEENYSKKPVQPEHRSMTTPVVKSAATAGMESEKREVPRSKATGGAMPTQSNSARSEQPAAPTP